MLPTLNIPISANNTVVKGDTFSGVTLTLKKGLTPIDLSSCTARINFLDEFQKNPKLLNTTAGLTIIDATNGVIQIDKIYRLDWNKGKHIGDLEITFPNNERITYCKVCIDVSEDITK
jgi:hypothetical protein